MSVLDEFYKLSEILDDDLADVAIIISHIMNLSGVKTTLTHVRDDCYNGGEEIMAKYRDFIQDALDMPISDIRAICDKKLANTTQLRAKIKELTLELKRVKAEAKNGKPKSTKKIKPSVIVHYTRPLDFGE